MNKGDLVNEVAKIVGTKKEADLPAPRMKEVFSLLWQRVSFRHIAFAAGLHAFVGYGAGTWNAPFLIRSHEMPITEVGSWLAVISGIGAIGTFLGGYLADKLAERYHDRRWYLWVPGWSTLIMIPCQFTAYLHGSMMPGHVRLLKDMDVDIAGRHVLIVEDIVDSGRTLARICQLFSVRSPASLQVVTLLDKPERREVTVPVSLAGFHVPDRFVVGYGLDLAEQYRHLAGIYICSVPGGAAAGGA